MQVELITGYGVGSKNFPGKDETIPEDVEAAIGMECVNLGRSKNYVTELRVWRWCAGSYQVRVQGNCPVQGSA